MKTKAILVSFHCYTPFGKSFYQPIEDYFIGNLSKYKNEFDRLYILDSQWGFGKLPDWVTVFPSDPNLRYYEAYKSALPSIKEDAVLLLDNDMVIYRPRVIFEAFEWLKKYDLASIYDTIGEKHFQKLNGQSKFCPYFFATRTEILKLFLNCEWGPVSWGETFSELTEKMLEAGLNPKEIEEDKSNFLFGEKLGDRRSKNLGYYHIRAGSTAPYLLSHRERGNKQYFDYIKNQPRSEYLRQFAWYQIMGGDVSGMLADLKIGVGEWDEYIKNFKIFYGL